MTTYFYTFASVIVVSLISLVGVLTLSVKEEFLRNLEDISIKMFDAIMSETGGSDGMLLGLDVMWDGKDFYAIEANSGYLSFAPVIPDKIMEDVLSKIMEELKKQVKSVKRKLK